jgi:hypothetical protein
VAGTIELAVDTGASFSPEKQTRLSKTERKPSATLRPLDSFFTNIATKPGIVTGQAGPENNAAAALLFASLQPVALIIHEETAPRVSRLPVGFMAR